MEKSLLTMETLLAPPGKVLLMYRAVAELIRENQDINQLTVGDITRRAGIGKGTAYEYFSAKDELIASALLYDMFGKLKSLMERVTLCADFRGKMECVFDWLSENREDTQTNRHMMQIFMGKSEGCEGMQKAIPSGITDGLREYIGREADAFLKAGREEGVYDETNPDRQRLALITAIVEYYLAMEGQRYCPLSLTEKELRAFVYGSMVRALQSR